MKDKIIVSMPDLLNFLDLLQEYGQTRDHVAINNASFEIKSVFFGDDPWIKADILAWANGQLEYKTNEKPI